ncbi:MAG: 50S ribosomal protein L9 [Opitutales bacterium]
MAVSEILLVKPVENLGGEGDQVRVKSGYARNYLLPRKIAIPVTKANRKQVEALKKSREVREGRDLAVAQELAEALKKARIAIAVRTGEGGKMFGAVTAADLHTKLQEAGIEIDKKKITLYQPIKELGKHTTKVKLHPKVTEEIEFDIVSENAIQEAEGES